MKEDVINAIVVYFFQMINRLDVVGFLQVAGDSGVAGHAHSFARHLMSSIYVAINNIYASACEKLKYIEPIFIDFL